MAKRAKTNAQRVIDAAVEAVALAISKPIGPPIDVATLAADQAQDEAFAAEALAITVADQADVEFADAVLTELVTRKDTAIAMRQRAVGPLKQGVAEIEAWFRPRVQALKLAEDAVKARIGAYRCAAVEAEAQARELAAVAAETGDAETLVTALEVATQAAEPDAARSTTRYQWAIERIAPDLLPDEWWSPDTDRIQAELDRHSADASAEKPVIPGVVIERRAIIGARR